MWNLILVMTPLDCAICGDRSWHFFRSYEEVWASECLNCRSSLHSISNYEETEKFIEWYKGQSI
jgi:hypothetical protein